MVQICRMRMGPRRVILMHLALLRKPLMLWLARSTGVGKSVPINWPAELAAMLTVTATVRFTRLMPVVPSRSTGSIAGTSAPSMSGATA